MSHSSRWRVAPDEKLRLDRIDADSTAGAPGDKEATKEASVELNDRLSALQERLWAEGQRSLLVVLQAMDTGGKDGVIRRVVDGVNPQGVKVASFKVPTPEDLAHDYLWRIHRHTPGKGEIVIFNRSHYEDVLVVRVHNLAPPEVWEKRFEHINAFERLLADEGTTILKFYLHISADEQKARLQARLDEPNKRWKFNPGDLKDRAFWGDYMHAYEDVLSKTSMPWAPWYIIPANRKWYRDLVIGTVIIETLEKLDMHYPQPAETLDEIVIA